MQRPPRSPHYTRQVTLSSGRQIDVAYFRAPNDAEPDEVDELHRCGGCGCEFVTPVDWAPASKSYWSITLRCPNCEWEGTGVYAEEVVTRYDDELIRGAGVLTRDLEQMTLENMADSVERFVTALNAGYILPGDF